MELDARIREFNSDYGSRLRGTFTYYQVNETVTETRTLSTDPGKILSGGSMTLTGTVTNDKSQIAGGALSVVGPNINNIGAGGERIITRVGTATVTQERSKGRKEYSSDYNVTLAGQPIELPVGTSGGNVQVSLSGQKPGATGTTAPGPVLVASVGLPGGTVVRTVSNPATIPDSQLFAVNNRPDAPISSPPTRASRASGPTCPATTCSTCCARPAACREPRRATRSAPAARWPARAWAAGMR